MHEAAIVQYAMRAVANAAEQNGIGNVTRIHLRIGILRGIFPEAMEYVFELLKKNDALMADCELSIEAAPAILVCSDCNAVTTLFEMAKLECEACHSDAVRILQGNDLQIVSFSGE